MALARYEGVVTDDAGNIVPLATIEVRRDQPGRPVVPLFADRAGTVPLGNPIQADALGAFGFHLPGGVYWVRAYSGPSHQPTFQVVKRYVPVGTAAERDVEELAATLNAGIVPFATEAAMLTFAPDADATVAARVFNDPDPSKNGDWIWVVDDWVKQRGFPDTLGRMEVTGGTANDLEAEIVNGVDPANVVMLFIEPAETNTAAVTINGKPLKNIDGGALIVGQFLAGRSYFLTDEGSEYRLRQDGDVSGIPEGIAAAAAAGLASIDIAKEDAIAEINPLVEEVGEARDVAVPAASAAIAAKVLSEAASGVAILAAANAQASARTAESWAVLSALAGTTAGQGAEVLDTDIGTHTDPVVGGTVLNAGRYTWSTSPAGWKRIGSTGLSAKVSTAVYRSEIQRIETFSDLLVAVVDSAERRTWLEARKTDGRPSDFAMSQLVVRLMEQFNLPLLRSFPGVLAAVTDVNDRQTWLSVRDTDGQFPEWVIQGLALRLQSYLSTALAAKGDTYVRGAEVLPVHTDMQKVVAWGSSTINNMNTQMTSLFAGIGLSYLNGGKGGERANHTCARMGSVPAKLTFPGNSIPASGSVVVTSSNLLADASMQSFTGVIGGVAATLSSTDTEIIFTRTTPGSAVVVAPDTQFIPTVGMAYRDAFTMLNLGKNDINAGTTAQLVIDYYNTSFDWLAPLIKRVIVIGQFSNRGSGLASSAGIKIKAINDALRARFPLQYLGLQEWLCGPQVWLDTGITPTSTDLAQQADGQLANSLSADGSHMDDPVETAFVQFQLKPKANGLGYYKL